MANVLRFASIEINKRPDGTWEAKIRGFGEDDATKYGKMVEESWALTLTNTVEQELTAIENRLKQLLNIV
jgi:hypothetical protein